MSKRSAKDELLARISADIERVCAVANYVGGDGTEALQKRIDADLARFEGMRNYVTAAVPAVTADAPKSKRTRGAGKKKGLPSAPSGETEATA
jgi:hypothetical protein